MPMPLVLRTDNQIRDGRNGRWTLSPTQPKTVPVFFLAHPRHDQWIFKDERGHDYVMPARSLKLVVGAYGGTYSDKALVIVDLPNSSWTPEISVIAVRHDYTL
jgi:hypothetical protein